MRIFRCTSHYQHHRPHRRPIFHRNQHATPHHWRCPIDRVYDTDPSHNRGMYAHPMGPGAPTLIPSQPASETTHIHTRPYAIPTRTLSENPPPAKRRLDNGSHPHHHQRPQKRDKRQFTIRPGKRKRSLHKLRHRDRNAEIPPHSSLRRSSIHAKRKPFPPQQHLPLPQSSHGSIQQLGNPPPDPEARDLRPRRGRNATVRRAAGTETAIAYCFPGAVC